MDRPEKIARIIYASMHQGWNVTPWWDLGNGQDLYLKAAKEVCTALDAECEEGT